MCGDVGVLGMEFANAECFFGSPNAQRLSESKNGVFQPDEY